MPTCNSMSSPRRYRRGTPRPPSHGVQRAHPRYASSPVPKGRARGALLGRRAPSVWSACRSKDERSKIHSHSDKTGRHKIVVDK